MKNSNHWIVLFALMLGVYQALGQETTISGTVRDATTQQPLVGASVLLKGSTPKGTYTDEKGRYTLEAGEGDSLLVFSYFGLETLEVPIEGRTTIDVALEPRVSNLDEVVVVGYGTQKRSKISGSVSVITAEEISETPVLRIEQALQGRAAGVQVAQNSGSPGGTLSVRIRGTGTINNSDPLYLVDGIPVEGLDFLNLHDIETVNVLKDAASAAIYGSRGANGVVLITTKSGRKGQKGQINYEGYYGIQNRWRKLDLLNAREYAIIQNEAYIASGRVPLPEFQNPDALGEGTDWQDAIFQSAPISNHQLSFMGGTEKGSYALTGSYFAQEGIVGGDKASFDRITLRLNAQQDINNWLSLGNNVSFIHLTRDALAENNEYTTPLIRAINMDPVTPVRKADGTYAYSKYSDTDITNPVNAIEQTYDTWTTNRVVGAVFGEITFSPELKLKSTYSMDATFATQNIFRPKFDLSNDPVLSDAPAQEKSLINTVTFANNNWRNWQWENVLTYNRQFGEEHNFTFVAGNTLQASRFDYNGGSNTNLPSNRVEDAYIGNTIDPISAQSTWQGASESSLLSYFGRVNYEFANKYLLAATFRADGSSRFGKNNRFGYFPSLSLGWIVSEEPFWNAGVLNFFKIRASWGQNGNNKIGDYSFTSVVLSGQNYVFGPNETITNGSVALVAPNPDLKWETITQTDIGLDLEFWQGKLSFTADYYIKATSDMLYAAPIPFTAGTAPPVQNIASMQNRGWEFALNLRETRGALSYSIGGNISFIHNEVTSLGKGAEPVSAGYIQSANAMASRTDVGHPLASFYGFVTDGIFQNQEEISSHAFQSEGTSPGDIRFKDLNNDGIINSEDRTYIGNPIPDFTYGFTGELAYKGLDLSLFIQGVQGNEIYNGTVRYDFAFVNRPASVLNRWTGPGTSNSEPRVTLSDPNQNVRVSDRFVEDGSYLRLKNLQIGYSLPAALLQKLQLNKLRVYFSAQNLLTFTSYSGMDPEIGVIGGSLEIGIDRGFYPQARTFTAGIQLGL
ncbi:MAG: TonB-dependent receptor [Bacteroidetes bacterium]|nr:MAG: TonB-dependent receptor [Bacteroidota bacterium]